MTVSILRDLKKGSEKAGAAGLIRQRYPIHAERADWLIQQAEHVAGGYGSEGLEWAILDLRSVGRFNGIYVFSKDVEAPIDVEFLRQLLLRDLQWAAHLLLRVGVRVYHMRKDSKP